MATKITGRLRPTTMAGLLRLALRDAKKIDPKLYFPYSGEWHTPQKNSIREFPGKPRCHVCLAGAVMAGSLKISPERNTSPQNLSQEAWYKLCAINYMREGKWKSAWGVLYGFAPTPPDSFIKLPAEDRTFTGWRAFRAHLKSLEAILPILERVERKILREIRALP